MRKMEIGRSRYADCSINDLHLAIKAKDVEKIKKVVDSGINVNTATKEGSTPGKTPLMFAVSEGSLEIVDVLLKAGAVIDKVNETNGMIAMEYAIHNAEMLEFLIEQGANINKSKFDLLFRASESGKLESIKVLIKHGANIHNRQPYHAREERGTTALMVAAGQGHVEIVEFLLNKYDVECNQYDLESLFTSVYYLNSTRFLNWKKKEEGLDQKQITAFKLILLNYIKIHGEERLHSQISQNMKEKLEDLAQITDDRELSNIVTKLQKPKTVVKNDNNVNVNTIGNSDSTLNL